MTISFSDTLNVLSNLPPIEDFPYPYTAIENCLPSDVYDRLVKKRPPWTFISSENSHKNNKRYDVGAFALLKSDILHRVWKDFVAYHTSHEFYLKILDKFEGYFVSAYPQLFYMRKYKTAIRNSGEKADIYLDCQLSVNTPVKEKSTVNFAHVDNPHELWAGLLYMREEDDLAGGDLIIERYTKEPTFHNKREADSDCFEHYKTIAYDPNVFVCFMNSPYSIHSVTEREVTDKPRLMVNFVLEMKEPLFHV